MITLLTVTVWLVFLLWYWVTYNSLVARFKATLQSWAHVEVELQRRHDLISNLVEVVRGYATHEKELFTKVAGLRGAAGSAQEANDVAPREAALLRQIMITVENYPDVKADQQFLSLQSELAETENRIADRRSGYNSCVSNYEIARTTFPAVIVAWAGKFQSKVFFDAPQEAEAPVQVKLS